MKRTLNLPSEHPTNSTAGRIARIWTSVVVIVFLLNALSIFILNRVAPNEASDRIRIKWHLAMEKNAPVDWLILGDSTAHHGLDPKLFPSIRGGRKINCGTIGQLLTVNDAWLLEQCIASSGPPARVVIMRCFLDWDHTGEAAAVAKIPKTKEWLMHADPPMTLSGQGKKDFFLTRYFPLYGQNLSLGFMLEYPWRNFSQADSGILSIGFTDGYKPDPGEALREASGMVKALNAAGPVNISHQNQAGLEAIGKLAEKYDFPVFFLDSPVVKQIAESPGYQRRMAAVDAFLHGMASRYPNFHLIQNPMPAFPANEMQNAVHLSGLVASKFTIAVVSKLSDTDLASTREEMRR